MVFLEGAGAPATLPSTVHALDCPFSLICEMDQMVL